MEWFLFTLKSGVGPGYTPTGVFQSHSGMEWSLFALKDRVVSRTGGLAYSPEQNGV